MTPPPQILPRDATTGRITFQAVVAAEGVSADELYSRAKLWTATTYRSAKTVVDLEDRDAGRLMVKGRMTIPYAGLSSMDIRYQVLELHNQRLALWAEPTQVHKA